MSGNTIFVKIFDLNVEYNDILSNLMLLSESFCMNVYSHRK